MKATLLVLLMLCAGCWLGATETPNPWTSDLSAALGQAREQDRLVLVNFTGSDWCVWCHRLRDEVFAKTHFLDYAKDQLLLVALDFPREKSLPPDQQEQNAAWAKKYSVSGFPTIVVLNSKGVELGRLTYMEGGAKTFVRALQRIARKANPAAASK